MAGKSSWLQSGYVRGEFLPFDQGVVQGVFDLFGRFEVFLAAVDGAQLEQNGPERNHVVDLLSVNFLCVHAQKIARAKFCATIKWKNFDTSQFLCKSSGLMSELSNKLRLLRGERSAEDAAKQVGLSRESFYRIERGGSVKLDTLRQIATGLKLSQSDWLELLIAWLKNEAGADKDHIWIESRNPPKSDVRDSAEAQLALLVQRFNELNPEERRQILLVMERPEARRALAALNKLYDSLRKQ
jgi:DNA-binding XRE family transcriptional regulator